ncbi:aminoacyl-tRNA hydrolase [Fusibacter ferrireducens]|uniref:Peptidyl-tRNA hydrolase n=1 Tax=Fusibacter ferrireducens TaxID=2785058 RepID=A0ABR9ZYU4_9FIRM|nr:aminoacyl-tRNA hydrolase [Fusibacter ferrireducens]MBF4695624.1 aminoacyl-tRNA hydrolase [Fusibacter ferrireducens]
MYVIVGLGNPGKQYQQTRHNVGFNVIDVLSEKLSIRVDKIKYKAVIGEGQYQGEKIMLVKPQTFMNLSGESVMKIMSYFDLQMENLVVIYDDIDTELGKLRIRKKGSAGTHNGMRNIIYLLQKDDFPRVRIGIGKPERGDLKDFVLKRFSPDEKLLMDDTISRAAEATLAIIREDVDKAMNLYNG